jgi:murein DD-endopeptidase MepM/ murein hydrolase activator NlpD
MGRVATLALGALLVACAAGTLAGCSRGPRGGGGTWHVIRSGDTLWSLAQRYDTTVDAIDRANDDLDPHALRIGQKLWIPRGGGGKGRVARRTAAAQHPATLERRPDDGDCGVQARRDGIEFDWPVLGRLTSTYGGRSGRPHDGIDLVADEGTPIHAAEAGRVVYEGDDLGDYGRVVIVKHEGRWATVYALNRRNLVDEGDFVEKGDY